MAGRFQRGHPHAAEFNRLVVAERLEGVFRAGGGAEVDRRAGAIAQLQVAGQEVGMEMGEEDVRDPQPVFRGEGEVTVHVALGVHDGRDSGGFIPDQVGRVREAIEVELLQDH